MGDKTEKRLVRLREIMRVRNSEIEHTNKKDEKFWDKWCHLLERSKTDVGKEDPAESESLTNLTDKHHSPMTVRKFTGFGFPIYVGLICDANLDALDQIVTDFMEADGNLKRWKSNKLQDKRDLAGDLTEHVVDELRHASAKRPEAVGVVFFIDKSAISSLFGDFMNHAMCRSEFYSILQMSTGV